MAVQRRVNWISQERVDVPAMRSVESAVSNDFDQLIQAFVTNTTQGYIMRGFNILMAGAIGNTASNLQVQVDPGALLHIAASQSGTVFMVPAGTSAQQLNAATNTNVTGAFTPSAINYVTVDYTRFLDPTTDAQIYIWDPSSNTETTTIAPTAQILTFVLNISTLTPTPNQLPIATVLTNAANQVVSITDSRWLFCSLSTGGLSPTQSYSYPWSQGRTANPETSSSDTIDPFSGNDKSIGSLKELLNAMLTTFKEMKGTPYWFIEGPTFPEIYQNAALNILSGGTWIYPSLGQIELKGGSEITRFGFVNPLILSPFGPVTATESLTATVTGGTTVTFSTPAVDTINIGDTVTISGTTLIIISVTSQSIVEVDEPGFTNGTYSTTLTHYSTFNLSENQVLYILLPTTDESVTYGYGADGSTPVNPQPVTSLTATTITVTSSYLFTVTSANATVGAVYSNNGQTFTVLETISSGIELLTTPTGAPLVSGTLTKVSGTGDSTITFSAATVESGNYPTSAGNILVHGQTFSYTSYTPSTGVFAGVTPNPLAIVLVGDYVYELDNAGIGYYMYSIPSAVPGVDGSGISLGAERVLWLAYYDGSSNIFLRNGQLSVGEAIAVGDTLSTSILSYIGMPNQATNNPTYSSNIRGVAQENLTSRVGYLTDAIGDEQEDRSAYFYSSTNATWSVSSGTGTVTFSSNIILYVLNTKSGTITTHTILSSASPISLVSGQMFYVEINRLATSENVTGTIAASLPAQTESTKDVFVLFQMQGTDLILPLSKQLIAEVVSSTVTFRIGAYPNIFNQFAIVGDLDWVTDNLYNIGEVSNSRPAHVYVGTSVQVGGSSGATILASQIQMPNGSVSAPSYSFLNSTSTGAYSPASNQYAISTNGVQAVYWDSNGSAFFSGSQEKVQIGFGNDFGYLWINTKNANGNGHLRVSDSNTNNTGKASVFSIVAYTISNSDTAILSATTTSSASTLLLGSSGSSTYAMTDVYIYTAANNTTIGGTQALHIDSSQNATFAGNVTAGASNGTALTLNGLSSNGIPVIKINSTSTGTTYDWIFASLTPNLGVGGISWMAMGTAPTLNNMGYWGFKNEGTGSTSNAITWGFFDNDQLMTLQATGSLAIGGSPSSAVGLYVQNSTLSSSDQYGIISMPTGSTSGISILSGINSSPTTAAASYTVTNRYGFWSTNETKGALSTITNDIAFFVTAPTQGSSSNAILSDTSSLGGTYGIYIALNANNYFAGNLLTSSDLQAVNGQFSGTVYLSNGSAGSPSLSFINSTATGMYRLAANDIGFSTNGNTTFRINAVGTIVLPDNPSFPTTVAMQILTTLGVGADQYAIELQPTINTSPNVYAGIYHDPTVSSGATAVGYAFYNNFAGNSNVTTYIAYGGTSLTSGSTNIAFLADTSSLSGQWGVYLSTANPNFLAGNTSFGTTSSVYVLTNTSYGTITLTNVSPGTTLTNSNSASFQIGGAIGGVAGIQFNHQIYVGGSPGSPNAALTVSGASNTKSMSVVDTSGNQFPIVTGNGLGSTNALRIIRGRVSSSGTISSGEGFTVSHPATGQYTVTFSTSFSDTPSVYACPEGNAVGVQGFYGFAFGGSISNSSFDFDFYQQSTATLVDGAWSFIAIGNR